MALARVPLYLTERFAVGAKSKVSIQYPGRDRTLPSVLDPFFSLDRTDRVFGTLSFRETLSFRNSQKKKSFFFPEGSFQSRIPSTGRLGPANPPH